MFRRLREAHELQEPHNQELVQNQPDMPHNQELVEQVVNQRVLRRSQRIINRQKKAK